MLRGPLQAAGAGWGTLLGGLLGAEVVQELVVGQGMAAMRGPARLRQVVVQIGGLIAAQLRMPRVEGLKVEVVAVVWLALGALALLRVGAKTLALVLATARIQQQAVGHWFAAVAGTRGCGATSSGGRQARLPARLEP